jgi:PAS domain S-box-containing protein
VSFEVPLPSTRWLDVLPDAALIADQDGRIQTVNAKTLELFGYQSHELLQQPIEILVPERLRSGHAGHRGNFFAHPEGRPMGAGLELSGRRRDGSEFPAEISISPIEADGRILVCAIIRDISERNRAEAERREHEARLQLIFDSTSELQVLFRVEPGDRFVVEMVNKAMRRTFAARTGQDGAQFVGKELGDFLAPMHLPAEAEEFRRSMCRKVAREKTAVQYAGASGPHTKDVEVTLSPVLSENGECTHLLWNARVVTDQVRAEAELREREERLRTVFNSHQDLQMLVRVEPGGRFVNEAFNQATYDYAREFVPDAGVYLERDRQDFLRALGIEESVVEQSLAGWQRAVREKIPLHFEMNSTVGSGKRRERADVSVVPILSGEGVCTHLLWTAHIMTERLQAAEELQRRERELGEAQSIGHIGSWRWEIAEGQQLVWSDEVYRILGYEPQSFPPPQLPGFLKMVHPDDRETVEKQTWAAFEARAPHDIEHRIVRPDGSVRFVRSRSRIQLDAGGKPVRLVATIHDVTEENEAAAREARRLVRLRKLSELSMMLAGDPATVLQRIVRMIGELFETKGVSLSEIVGDEAVVRAVYDGGRVAAGSARCPLGITPCATVAAARDIRIYERVQEKFPRAAYLAGFGAYTWCGFPSLDGDGNVVAVTSLMDDKPREFSAEDQQILRLIGQRIAVEFERAKGLAERAHMEEKLRENQGRLEEAQHMAHLGSWYSSDALGGVMEWSPELYSIYEADPATDTPEVDLVMSRTHPDDRARVMETREALLKGTGGFESEYRLQMPDGRIKYVIVQGSVSAGPDGKTQMGGTVQDITERKRAEQERENLQAQLAQAQKMESIGRLAGGIAHDFNNMLTVILGYATLCRRALANYPKLEKHMGEIVKAATRSKEITEKLLGFSRQQIIAPVPSNLNEIIADLKEPLSRLIGEDIELVFNPRAGLWKVVVDAAQINQILLNLVVNARDAMPHGGKLRIEVANVDLSEEFCRRHPEARRGRYVLLTVRDSGVGMDQDTMSHIFEPFFTTKDNEKGTGLGLATVYGIVQQNAGFITVESELQVGTVFRIYFPKMIGEDLPADAALETPAMHTGRGTVLLVEDDERVREITSVTLEAMGYTPLVADTAKHAIEFCAGERGKDILMVLTDVVMPDMNGMEMRDRIMEINPAIRVLFMSGYTPNVIVNHGVLQNGVHFIQKPFTIEDLGKRVEEVLAAE